MDNRPIDWDVEQVCAWLSENKLDELANRFREEKVDGLVLFSGEITDEDLKNDLDIKAFGVRKRLLILINNVLHSSNTSVLSSNFSSVLNSSPPSTSKIQNSIAAVNIPKANNSDFNTLPSKRKNEILSTSKTTPLEIQDQSK